MTNLKNGSLSNDARDVSVAGAIVTTRPQVRFSTRLRPYHRQSGGVLTGKYHGQASSEQKVD